MPSQRAAAGFVGGTSRLAVSFVARLDGRARAACDLRVQDFVNVSITRDSRCR